MKEHRNPRVSDSKNTKHFSESETLELKKSTSELKEGVISIVAILNKHRQGRLIFGVKNNGEVIGQTITENTLREVSRAITDNIEPGIYPIVKRDFFDGKGCVVVDFSGKERPYFAYGRAYIRVSDENKLLSPNGLKMFFTKDVMSWEREHSEKGFNDVNNKALKKYIQRANDAKRISYGFTNVKSTLNKLGLVKDGKLLRGGEALFCDSIEVQMAVFAGVDKLTFLDIKKINGNIFDLMEMSEEYIKEHINWNVKFGKLEREEVPEIPIEAIRESLVNSFCHRDYNNPKGNEVAIFKNRVEIYNPGNFPEGYMPEDFIKGTEKSILRNPIIANTLYLSKDIEKWGSGLKRIYDSCRENNIKVEFNVLKSGFSVVFYRKIEFVGKNVGKNVGKKERQENILIKVKKGEKFTIKSLAEELGINEKTAERDLKELQDKANIKFVGPKKTGEWKLGVK